ncbi:hypothetical protein D3C76_1405900 [compost metagenome]
MPALSCKNTNFSWRSVASSPLKLSASSWLSGISSTSLDWLKWWVRKRSGK